MKGFFIEDMEKIQEEYESRFVHYSNEFHFKKNIKAESKMIHYKDCVEKMRKVMRFINTL